jgi:hypothetical protein
MRGNSSSTIRAIRGPITLITVGVLFALNNFTEYSFGRTWPVILIVFGLLSLLRRGIEPTVAPPAGGPGAPGAPPPPPYGYPAPGGYSRSPYTAGPTSKPGDPNAPPGGSV